MILALDYDGTYTEDADLWLPFIDSALSRGHKVVCVTARKSNEGMDEKLLSKVEVIFTNGFPKIKSVWEQGKQMPHVWIEDNPHLLFEEGQVPLPDYY